MGDESAAVSEHEPLEDHHGEPKHQQRRAERGSRSVVRGRSGDSRVHLRGQHIDAVLAAKQQGGCELAQAQQQHHSERVHKYGPQQRQNDVHHCAAVRRTAHLSGFDEFRADVPDPTTDEEVDESTQCDPGDDDDPCHRVDVDRALEPIRPPRQKAQPGIDVSSHRRQQESPANDGRHGGEDDRQDGNNLQEPEAARKTRGCDRQRGTHDHRERNRCKCERDRRCEHPGETR